MDENKFRGQISFNSPPTSQEYKNSQIENLQASLASVTGQLLNMQETLGEKDIEINDLTNKLNQKDHTLTIVEALIKLYTKLLLPGKVE